MRTQWLERQATFTELFDLFSFNGSPEKEASEQTSELKAVTQELEDLKALAKTQAARLAEL